LQRGIKEELLSKKARQIRKDIGKEKRKEKKEGGRVGEG